MAELRNQVAAATSPAEAMKASDALYPSGFRYFCSWESYPDLKASANFVKLQEELTNTENKILTRQLYNSVVSNYNVKLETFPSNLLQDSLGLKRQTSSKQPEVGKGSS